MEAFFLKIRPKNFNMNKSGSKPILNNKIVIMLLHQNFQNLLPFNGGSLKISRINKSLVPAVERWGQVSTGCPRIELGNL